jgi:hypothetical protein
LQYVVQQFGDLKINQPPPAFTWLFRVITTFCRPITLLYRGAASQICAVVAGMLANKLSYLDTLKKGPSPRIPSTALP